MDKRKKKTILMTIGSILIGAGVIWGVIGFKLKYFPMILLVIVIGCVFSYFGKRIQD
jgi:uncharacterized membrane protein